MGTLRICLDAGHYAKCNWNPNVSPIYWESLMAWDLHLMLREELERYQGVTVIRTREDQTKDLDLTARGRKAAGCDLFLSLHSNACNTERVDRPVAIYPVSGKGRDLAAALAKAIREVMQTDQAEQIYNRWNSAGNADYYGVIRGAASVGVPGIILEHSFHTNNRAALWLEDPDNLRKLAVAEARVLAAHYHLTMKEDETDMTKEEVKALIDSAVKDKTAELVKRAAVAEQAAEKAEARAKAAEKAAEDAAAAMQAVQDRFGNSLKDLWSCRMTDYLTARGEKDAAPWSEADRAWAVEQGLIQGTGTNPDGSVQYAWANWVTREQLAAILHRYDTAAASAVAESIGKLGELLGD